MRNEIIDRTQAFLREMLGKSEYLRSHREDLDYRLEHSFRVAHIGKEIAEAEGMDVEKMIVACLLHDVGYYMDFADEEDYINHGRVGAAAARPFLEELGYSENDIDEICYGIAIHVDDIAGFDGERTVFALTMTTALKVLPVVLPFRHAGERAQISLQTTKKYGKSKASTLPMLLQPILLS